MKNSSTSSSDTPSRGGGPHDGGDAAADARAWVGFMRIAAASCLVLLGLVAVFIVVLDPHDHLAVSPAMVRAPINANQRYSYPALARSPRFDSVVIGTSTARLLKPEALNAELGGTFANLAMNSATSYEQTRLLSLFVRSRPEVRTVLFGVDAVWCERNPTPVRYTPRPFPEWLYDDNPWNDYVHLLNGPTLEQAARQLEFQLGWREPRFGFDGYRTFLPPIEEYNLEKARRNLYGGDGTPRPPGGTPGEITGKERNAASYGALDNLRHALSAVPVATRVVFWLVPYHYFHIGGPESKRVAWLADCKRRIVELAASRPNSYVLDMMFASDLTRADSNYWDPLHFSEAVAAQLPGLLRRAAEGSGGDPSVRRLFPGPT